LPLCRHIFLRRSHFFKLHFWNLFLEVRERRKIYTNFLKLREISIYSFVAPQFPICPFYADVILQLLLYPCLARSLLSRPHFLFHFLFFTLASVIVHDRLYR
jgi:hypothetical protein